MGLFRARRREAENSASNALTVLGVCSSTSIMPRRSKNDTYSSYHYSIIMYVQRGHRDPRNGPKRVLVIQKKPINVAPAATWRRRRRIDLSSRPREEIKYVVSIKQQSSLVDVLGVISAYAQVDVVTGLLPVLILLNSISFLHTLDIIMCGLFVE